MKSLFQHKSLFSCFSLACALAAMLSSCESQEQLPSPATAPSEVSSRSMGDEKVKTFYGPATPLGQGVARAWVSTDKERTPLSVGVTISAHAVEALVHGGGHDHQGFLLKLPKQAEKTLYKHFVLDWNPHGHPAPGIYDLPHFDLHAYMISEEERLAIVPMPPFNKMGQPLFDERPAPEFIPQDYVLEPGIVPAMGAHWLDRMAPELHGEIFTKTFIYGSYHGEFIFHEPMFTVAYLNTLKHKANLVDSYEIKQPQRYQKAGYYPMEYSFRYDPTPGQFIISLDNLVYKQ